MKYAGAEYCFWHLIDTTMHLVKVEFGVSVTCYARGHSESLPGPWKVSLITDTGKVQFTESGNLPDIQGPVNVILTSALAQQLAERSLKAAGWLQ
ncbi:MAG: hypothetical protein Fues2KO_14290 [Fuerstiella sp.]